MEKNGSSEYEEKSSETTLDFDFDDIPEEEFDFGEEATSSDAETIDLENIVEDVEEDIEGDDEDIQSLLDDDPFASEETEDDVDLTNALKELEEAAEEDMELELSGSDMDEIEKDTGLEGAGVGDAEAEVDVEVTVEEEEVTTFELPSEEETSPGASELGEESLKSAPSPPPAGEPVQISEEKLEAVVTRVVENVVERVAKDTMTSVADKVIRETIEMLKESIDPSEK